MATFLRALPLLAKTANDEFARLLCSVTTAETYHNLHKNYISHNIRNLIIVGSRRVSTSAQFDEQGLRGKSSPVRIYPRSEFFRPVHTGSADVKLRSNNGADKML